MTHLFVYVINIESASLGLPTLYGLNRKWHAIMTGLVNVNATLCRINCCVLSLESGRCLCLQCGRGEDDTRVQGWSFHSDIFICEREPEGWSDHVRRVTNVTHVGAGNSPPHWLTFGPSSAKQDSRPGGSTNLIIGMAVPLSKASKGNAHSINRIGFDFTGCI